MAGKREGKGRQGGIGSVEGRGYRRREEGERDGGRGLKEALRKYRKQGGEGEKEGRKAGNSKVEQEEKEEGKMVEGEGAGPGDSEGRGRGAVGRPRPPDTLGAEDIANIRCVGCLCELISACPPPLPRRGPTGMNYRRPVTLR